MDRRLIVTLFALALVIAGSAAFARRSAEEPAAPLNEGVSGVQIDPDEPEAPEPSAAEEEYTYLLREYDGRVAIFPYSATADSEPEIVLDTLVKYLPDYDRSQMQEGIPVRDYRELVTLIEDYIS